MSVARTLTKGQRVVLAAAFVPMLATGVAGGAGTFSNVSGAYGRGTALGAVAAGEGATAVLALVLLGLTMLGQSSPWPVRAGLWVLPAAASAMAAMAADDPGRTVIYAVTPLGMSVSAEGMAFLARRIVVHTDGRDAEAERKAAAVMQALAYHRARAANHPDERLRKSSERRSWRLARKVGTGDAPLGARLLDVQRDRVTTGADTALAEMFAVPVTPAVTPTVTPTLPQGEPQAERAGEAGAHDEEDTQVSPDEPGFGPAGPDTPVGDGEGVTPESVTGVTPSDEAPASEPDLGEGEQDERAPVTPVTLAEVAAVAAVTTPEPGEPLTDDQLTVVLRHLRYSVDPPMSYRQAATAFRDAGFVGGEKRVRTAWGALLSQEENTR